MNDIWQAAATSGICAVLLCAVLFGIYKIAMSLINGISEMIKNAIFHVTVDSRENKEDK